MADDPVRQAWTAEADEIGCWLRPAAAADFDEIRHVEFSAFRRPDEADLVDALRAGGYVLVEWVAEDGDDIVGHALVTRLAAAPDQFKVSILAPLAVRPEHQRKGIGGALVRRVLRDLKTRGEDLVVVLGHPDYYPQFGFDHDIAQRISGPWSGVGDAWMAAPLSAAGRRCGLISIMVPAPFDDID